MGRPAHRRISAFREFLDPEWPLHNRGEWQSTGFWEQKAGKTANLAVARVHRSDGFCRSLYRCGHCDWLPAPLLAWFALLFVGFLLGICAWAYFHLRKG